MRALASFFLALGVLLDAPHAAGAAAGVVPATESVFKCRGATATPVYQDRPCPPERELRDFVADPANVSVIPFALPAPPRASKPARPERTARPPPKHDKRKAQAERRTSDAAVGERRHVKDGMSDGEVLAKLGPPDLQSGKTGRKMRWTYLPAAGDPQTVTLVRFDDGKVVAVERTTMR